MKVKLKKRKDKFPFDYFLKINLFVLVLGTIVFDQLTKIVAVFTLPMVCNRGVAFGIPGGGIFFSAAILALVLFIMRYEKNRLNLAGLTLVFAGGFSNFVDRVVFGCVRDFIKVVDFFPVFNFADVAITVGLLGFIYFAIIKKYGEA